MDSTRVRCYYLDLFVAGDDFSFAEGEETQLQLSNQPFVRVNTGGQVT